MHQKVSNSCSELATKAQPNSSSYIDGNVATNLGKCMQTAATSLCPNTHQHRDSNRKVQICAVDWRVVTGQVLQEHQSIAS